MKFTLTYARAVILERTIDAPDEDTAPEKASKLELDGELGLRRVLPASGSRVVSISDYETIWEVRPTRSARP